MDGESNHPIFLKRLERSREGVFFAAYWWQRKNCDVRIPFTPQAKTREEWREFVDHGDLEVFWKGQWRRVEVKWLRYHFSDGYWPFRKDFIVCAKHQFDEATPKPWAYYMLNPSADYCAILLTKSHAQWRVEWRKDLELGEDQEFYLAPLEQVQFRKYAFWE